MAAGPCGSGALLAHLHTVPEPDAAAVGVASRWAAVAVPLSVAVPLLGAVHVDARRRAVAVADSVEVPLLGSVGMLDRGPVFAVELAVAIPLLAAAGQDQRRGAGAVQPPLRVPPSRAAMGAVLRREVPEAVSHRVHERVGPARDAEVARPAPVDREEDPGRAHDEDQRDDRLAAPDREVPQAPEQAET